MFDCRCSGTTGRFIKLANKHKLWICDLCKGVRIFKPEVNISSRLIDPNYEWLVARHKARLAELVDAQDLKS